ncbi:CoA transferase [Fodinisporobacter ferrooxydans]|uniref:CoA transferase n=1 Tax=Fodinisporobacter ferrooxydans TaxID=2901836 RepID=A0ABY4CDZ5_9BACL|nr:CoA transferase [Alicyclobacillaceae bacterium MYW30-H2]
MKPLADLTIIDLTRILSGPFSTMFFADMGANVIKVEPPNGDDTRTWGPPFLETESSYFLSINRNKKSIVLDLKSETGKNVLRQLIKKADVVIENFRPGTLERLGFGFENLKTINPRIILASISGFGQTGRYRDEPGYDLIAQGMGGLMSVTGQTDGHPVKGGFSLADVGSGMWAIIGILTALHNRNSNGNAQWIDVSLLETMISWQTYLSGNYFASGKNPKAMGSAHPNICPYQAFPAKDGYFNLAVGNDKLWEIFCKAVNEQAWLENENFKTNPDRVRNRETLIPLLESKFKTKTVNEWVTIFRKQKIPCGPIYNLSELFEDPYVIERNMLQTVEHPTAGRIKLVNTPVKFLETTSEDAKITPPPLLGQHTEQILREFDINETEIKEVLKNIPTIPVLLQS